MSAEKKTIEELILSKPITPEIVNRLFYVYNSDWNRYVNMNKRILDQSILLGAQDIKVLVDRIDSVPSCENENYEEKLFTDEKKKIFCMWLFKSHILCLNADERIVGRKIEHDLPITFKIYFSKNMTSNINASDSLEFKIKQATKLQDLIMKQLKPILEEFDFYIKPVGAFTSESEFDSFQISLGFNSYYSKSEDIYIKTFVKDIIHDEKKLKEAKESLDQSTELFGLGKKKEKKEEKIVKLTKEEATKAVKNCVKLLKDAFTKNGNPKGFNVYPDSELKENIEEYLDEENTYNSVIIGGYDAWEFTNNKARDEKEYEKFNNTLIKIENTIKDLMKQTKCPYNISSDGGDWDDGNYTVYFTQKSNLEHDKNYMG